PLVERIDSRAPLLDGVPVYRPGFRQLDATLDLALGELLDPSDRPLPENRPLLDSEGQDQPVGGGSLLGHDVIELTRLEQGGDGALNVAVIEGLMDDDARGTDDLSGGEAGIPLDGDAVDGGRGLVLGEERR